MGLPEPLPTGARAETGWPAPRLVSPGPHPQSQGGPHTHGEVRLRGSHTVRRHQAGPFRSLSCPSVAQGSHSHSDTAPTPPHNHPTTTPAAQGLATRARGEALQLVFSTHARPGQGESAHYGGISRRTPRAHVLNKACGGCTEATGSKGRAQRGPRPGSQHPLLPGPPTWALRGYSFRLLTPQAACLALVPDLPPHQAPKVELNACLHVSTCPGPALRVKVNRAINCTNIVLLI